MNTVQKIDKTNLEAALAEIEDAYFDIPFANTDFQCESFVIANAITPTRAYRTIGLQIHSLLQQLRDVKYNERLKLIDIEELQEKINDPTLSRFEKSRKEIELQRMLDGEKWNQKLVTDLIRQLNLYYTHFKAFPKFTREEFESGEKTYFEQSQHRMILGLTGPKESVLNMTEDLQTVKNFESLYAALPADKNSEMLLGIAEQALASRITFTEK